MPIPSGPKELLVLILHSNDSTSFSFVVNLSKRVSVRHLKFDRSGIIEFLVKDDIDAYHKALSSLTKTFAGSNQHENMLGRNSNRKKGPYGIRVHPLD